MVCGDMVDDELQKRIAYYLSNPYDVDNSLRFVPKVYCADIVLHRENIVVRNLVESNMTDNTGDGLW